MPANERDDFSDNSSEEGDDFIQQQIRQQKVSDKERERERETEMVMTEREKDSTINHACYGTSTDGGVGVVG